MNKTIAFVLLTLLSLAATAEEPKKPYDPAKDRPTTPEELALRKQWIAKRRYEHFGGDLVKPGTMKGVIAVVNCQKSADASILGEAVAYLKKETRFDIVLKDGAFALGDVKPAGDFSLFVVDDAALPKMLIAPEDKWAMLNIAPLKAGRGEKPAFFRARILKEMSRTFAGLCGGISSNYPDSLTTGIYNLDQLDRQEDNRLSVDVIARFAPSLAAAGVTPAHMTTYLAACKQGWAPEPTNDVQKAIWNQVHAIPDKPITIEFDPKKDK